MGTQLKVGVWGWDVTNNIACEAAKTEPLCASKFKQALGGGGCGEPGKSSMELPPLVPGARQGPRAASDGGLGTRSVGDAVPAKRGGDKELEACNGPPSGG
jgi:hypothetical protein